MSFLNSGISRNSHSPVRGYHILYACTSLKPLLSCMDINISSPIYSCVEDLTIYNYTPVWNRSSLRATSTAMIYIYTSTIHCRFCASETSTTFWTNFALIDPSKRDGAWIVWTEVVTITICSAVIITTCLTTGMNKWTCYVCKTNFYKEIWHKLTTVVVVAIISCVEEHQLSSKYATRRYR